MYSQITILAYNNAFIQKVVHISLCEIMFLLVLVLLFPFQIFMPRSFIIIEIYITQVLIPIANGSEEIEVVTIADILRRAKVNVVVASVEKSVKILASQGTKIIADKLIGDAAESIYDIIILPVKQTRYCFRNTTSFKCMGSQI